MPEMKMGKSDSVYLFLKILLSATIAVIALNFSIRERIDHVNLAKGEQNTSQREVFAGKPYTAFAINDMMAIIQDSFLSEKTDASPQKANRILWLGNSQLHYINQYQPIDHLSPFWLKSGWNNLAFIEPLGFSLPNANFQEFLILSRYVQSKLPVNLVIVKMVFDDLREDGLRRDFADILTPDIAELLRKQSASAESVIHRFLLSQKITEGDTPKSVLSGTIQEPVEKWLNQQLGSIWQLWADRPQIEGNFFYGLYRLRNLVFGIKPTTVRKMIPARYDLNMAALADMLEDSKRNGTPALLYIAPIRQDKPIPYDSAEYAAWKQEVDTLAKQYGARLVNLETLVPGELWGSYVGEEIDFMHFKGPGHKLVAEALLPHVKNLLAEQVP